VPAVDADEALLPEGVLLRVGAGVMAEVPVGPPGAGDENQQADSERAALASSVWQVS